MSRSDDTRSTLESEIEIANPGQPHCPVVLLLDTSGSMDGEPIEALRKGLNTFRDEVMRDDLARLRVDLSIVTFGGDCNQVRPFSPVDEAPLPTLEAQGSTPMGEALELGMNLIRSRKDELSAEGVDYYRPWLFLLTDGSPTDMDQGDDTWTKVAGDIAKGVKGNAFSFFPIGVEGADMEALQALSGEVKALRLKGLAFSEFFKWLSRSLSARSRSKTSESVALENPIAPNGWATV